jgi:ATP-binding cassette subfamily B protein
MKNLLRALRYFRPDAPRLVFVFFLMLASIGLNVLKPWPLALIVDCVLGSKPLPKWVADLFPAGDKAAQIGLLAMVVLVVHVSQGALSAFQNFAAIKIGLRGLTRVRNEVFAKLQALSLKFHQGTNAGDLIYRASWDTYAFQTLFQQGLVIFTTAFLSLLVMVVVMVQLNWRLTLIGLAIAPMVVLSVRIFGARMSARSSIAHQADSQVTSLVQQNIASMPLIQCYTREEREKERFASRVQQAQDSRVKQHGSELLYWFVVAGCFGLGTAAITWFGANQVLAGKLTIGELIVFLAYLAQLYEPLNQLSHVGATVSGANAGVRRVFEILDAPEEIKQSIEARGVHSPGSAPTTQPGLAAASEPIVARGNVEFSDVHFCYQPGREVLRGLSFSIPAGQSVALIGPSGAGKTTLLKLLPRFFDPEKGSIKLEGFDIRTLRVKDLREQMAFVLQDSLILPTTIAENIGYGKPNATQQEIEAAAQAANAADFIRRLPQGYETVIGDGATRLSVGEQQRISLARAFLKDAPILVLDEPTSALDAENEGMILESLRNLMRGRTTLIVAHRLKTIQQVDRIFVLQDGKLVESGTARELTAAGGYYARMMTQC